MIHYKTEQEIETIRRNCEILNSSVAHVVPMIAPGISTMELNGAIEKYIIAHGGIPSFKDYNGFPYACCISVNDAVVHGFPSDVPLRDGDVVSVDVGVYKDKFHADSAYTFAIGNVSDEVKDLLRITKQSLYKGIEKARAGNRVGDIAFAIQEHTEKKHGYGVVRELVGHGLGKNLHEDPQVPNYGKRGSGQKLKSGLVIAIEPMINLGVKEVYNDEDGWTIRTADKKPSAHYEHTICVRKDGADMLTSFEKIEAAERENSHLFSDY